MRMDLDVYGGLLRAVSSVAEHLLRASRTRICDQQLQNPGALDVVVDARVANTSEGFDADGGVVGVGEIGLQDHPQRLARVEPLHGALGAAQPDLKHGSGVVVSGQIAARNLISTLFWI